ncbi:MAG TPA: hypothetical protein PK602_06340 [Methanothrix sp.]|nr:hypothetical protein [Methanothrix sp.]
MKKIFAIVVMAAILLMSQAEAANYMYEKASVKGVGYRDQEIVVSTQTGFEGQKLVAKTSGSGNIITDNMELEVERQLQRGGVPIGSVWVPENDTNGDGEIGEGEEGYWERTFLGYATGTDCPMDYINYTREAEFEYMPVSYQTGTYDQKWIDKLCVQNYRIGAVLTEMYSHAEHLQKTTEVKTRGYGLTMGNGSPQGYSNANGCSPGCTGVLEANLNSNVIGVAHIGWISRDPKADPQLKGRHAEYGRSVDDLTGVFSVEKFIQLWGNSTCGSISVDWLPCV